VRVDAPTYDARSHHPALGNGFGAQMLGEHVDLEHLRLLVRDDADFARQRQETADGARHQGVDAGPWPRLQRGVDPQPRRGQPRMAKRLMQLQSHPQLDLGPA
jgi:hypothetical protein